jgi:hypothetical protein
MVDQANRQYLLSLLQELQKQSVSYYTFTARSLASVEDRGVAQIWINLEELLENDLAPRKAIELNNEHKSLVRRCILFLRSNEEYKWPDCAKQSYETQCLLILLTFVDMLLLWFKSDGPALLGIIGVHAVFLLVTYCLGMNRTQKAVHQWTKFGHLEAWPFVTLAELESAEKVNDY